LDKIDYAAGLETDALTDEEMVELACQGDGVMLENLLNKYKNFVKSKARSYFLVGADREDIVQEGMIGLYKAIRDFRADRLTSFKAFAELCITRQIITAYEESSDRSLLDMIAGGGMSNPEEFIIGQEDLQIIETQMGKMLSGLEMEVLTAYLKGKSYQEISEELGRHVKSIDNALQRVKRKLEKYLEEK